MAYIYWDPDINVFDLGFFSLRWYSLIFALGFLSGYLKLKHAVAKEGFPEPLLEKLTFYVIISAVLGARLGHVLFYDFQYYIHHLPEIFLPFTFRPSFQFVGFQGLASHGGIIAILCALILYSKRYHVKLLWILDRLALVVPLAACMIRLGNLANSEIVGIPADVPWAFVFQQVDKLPRHPAQLYEAAAYLGIFILLNCFSAKLRKKPGFTVGLLLTLVFSVRFLMEFLKADQSDFEADMVLNMGQLLSLPFIVLGVLLMMRKKKQDEKYQAWTTVQSCDDQSSFQYKQ